MSRNQRSKLQGTQGSFNMASKGVKSDDLRSFVKPASKNLAIKNTKASLKMHPSVPEINVGLSACPTCDIEDKSNMIECYMCYRSYHYTCEILDYEEFEFLIKKKDKIPYRCKDCTTFTRTFLGRKIITESPIALRHVSQMREEVSLLEAKVKIIEQRTYYEENSEFQEIIKRKVANHIESIKDGIREMETKFEKVSSEIKTNSNTVDNGFCRRKRIILFGMPNSEDDLEAVQNLSEELKIDKTNIKKIFRLNSKSNDNFAPPINVEFYSMEDKWKFLNKNTREKLQNLPENNKFHGVSVAPDRSFIERQKYYQMRVVMNQRNVELANNGVYNYKWIIKKMRLERVEAKQDIV